LHHYCIVRSDLPRGILAAQLIHAAGESSTGNLPDGTYAIALAAQNEAELLAIEERLKISGISFRAIRENSGPCEGQITAIGVLPAEKGVLKRLLSSLPLLK
jgi:peptidyl-tRNA hydrolase